MQYTRKYVPTEYPLSLRHFLPVRTHILSNKEKKEKQEQVFARKEKE